MFFRRGGCPPSVLVQGVSAAGRARQGGGHVRDWQPASRRL